MNNKMHKNRIGILRVMLLIVSCVIACMPLVNRALPGGYMPDLGYNMIRIEGVKEALLNHTYPTRVYSFAMGDYGYAGSMYYQDYFFIIAALARLCGVSIKGSYRLLIVIIQINICASTYYAVRYISKNEDAATISTIMLQLSQFYLADLYDRSGLSESLSMIFMPLLFAGLYSLFEDDKRMYLIGIGLVGTMMCHSIPFFFAIILTIICMILCIPRFIKNPKLFLRLLLIGLFSMMISAVVYIPLLEQLFMGENGLSKQWFRIGDMAEPVKSFFRMYGHYNLIAYIGVGIPVLICLVLRVVFIRRRYGWADRFIIIALVLLASTTSIVPWRVFEDTFIGIIQFPYRLYILAFPFLMIGCGMFFAQLISPMKQTLKIAIILMFCGIIYLTGIKQVRSIGYAEETYDIDDDYFSHVENTINIGAGEWLPRGADLHGIPENDTDITALSGLRISNYLREYNSLTFDVDDSSQSYTVPLVFYRGYKATLTTASGTILELPIMICDTNRNRIQIINNSGKGGSIRVWYAGTVLQRISLCISIFGCIVCVVYLYIMKRYKQTVREE